VAVLTNQMLVYKQCRVITITRIVIPRIERVAKTPKLKPRNILWSRNN